MAILSALQSAAVRLMGQRPTTFFGSNGNFEAEICDLADEVAADICQYQDWQALVRIANIVGDGVLTAFDLPADYARMLTGSKLADLSSWFWNYGAYQDINAFLYSEARGFNGYPGGWIIYGDQLRFSPAPSTTQIATLPYITAYYALDVSTKPKAGFTADTDEFLLPDRLLTLGLVWRWRENKKLDATGDQEAFIKALDEYAVKDRGARVYSQRSRRSFPGTYTAWPGTLGPSTYLDA